MRVKKYQHGGTEEGGREALPLVLGRWRGGAMPHMSPRCRPASYVAVNASIA